jgi:hypothetical protein
MARYLAIFTDNHGEEFDVHGFKIMTAKEVSKFEDMASSITWDFEYYANSESLLNRAVSIPIFYKMHKDYPLKIKNVVKNFFV